MTSLFCERGQTGLGVVKLQSETVECRVCGRLAPAYERSQWCRDCTERVLAEQQVELESFRQDPEIVERPDLKVVPRDV